MQSEYSKAILRLIEITDEHYNGGKILAALLAVIRGPDHNQFADDKKQLTFPIRLYLLGAKAYKEAGYAPDADYPRANDLPTSEEIGESQAPIHFLSHIARAVEIIEEYNIQPHDVL